MRILIVSETFYPSIDGVVTRLIEAVRYITRAGHEVAVVAPDLGEDNFEGVPIFGVPAHTLPLYRHRQWGLPSKKVYRYIEEFAPDVVHVANPLLIGLSGVKSAKQMDLPLVVSYHTNISKYLGYYHLDYKWVQNLYWSLMRKLHNSADINLCTSRAVQKLLRGNGIERVYALKRGVDTLNRHPRFKSDAMRYRLSNGHPDDLLMVFVGRLAAEKELERLRPLLDRAPDLRLAVVGDGPAKAKLERVFSGSNTVFIGYLQGEQLSKAYASADFFAFPSITETLGLVILEAMASGLPVMAARSEPTIEQIIHGETGCLYDSGDTDSMMDALEMLRDTELRNKMSISARHQAERFSWTVTSQQLLDYYHLALARNRRMRFRGQM